MIIQCEQCQTRFRLDDAKVTDKGVKVRCARCKHVFSVKKEQPETEAQSDFDALLDRNVSSGGEEGPSAPFTQQQGSPAPEPPPGDSFDFSEFIAEDFSGRIGRPDSDLFEPTREGLAPAEGSFSFTSLSGDPGVAQEQDETNAAAGDVGFAGFDFGDGITEAGKTAPTHDFGASAMIPAPDATTADEEENSGEFDFDDEPMFGDAGAGPEVVLPGQPVGADALAGEFAASMEVKSPRVETAPAAPAGAKGEEPFSLGGIDFGDEPAPAALQRTHPDEGKQAVGLQVPWEEQPPLSIASRRRHDPIFSVLIAAATVVAVALLGFFGYTKFFAVKAKAVVESGSITVRSVNASFVKNSTIGDLLVITGEAVNSFAKPRAAIQVKGMVYGANGQVLASKNAYCGNPLTKEQLAVMPLEKIEASMANQFGDSLANMEVVPGKAIPFVIVIAKPPAESREYGVEPLGSTVASGK